MSMIYVLFFTACPPKPKCDSTPGSIDSSIGNDSKYEAAEPCCTGTKPTTPCDGSMQSRYVCDKNCDYTWRCERYNWTLVYGCSCDCIDSKGNIDDECCPPRL